MKSVSEARGRVDAEVRAVIEWVQSADSATATAFESELWTRVLAVGAALFALFLACRAARPRPARYEVDGHEFVVTRGGMTTRLATKFGWVSFWQPTAERVGKKNRQDLPLSRELKIGARFTLGVMTTLGELCARMPFASARAVFRKFCGWVPSPKVVLRLVDALGVRVRPFIDQLAPPEKDGEVLVVEVDGRGAPMISPAELARRAGPRRHPSGTARASTRERRREHPKPRRTKGKKSKNAKVAVVGVLYTLKRTRRGLDGPINKRMIATFESHEALFQWLVQEARKRGYGRKTTVFIADGSDHIWRLQQRYLPDVIPCIDFWHVAEKLWEAGTLLFKEGTSALNEWYAAYKTLLRRGKANAILDELGKRIAAVPKTGPRNKWRRKRLIDIQKYVAEHQARMHYDRLRRDDMVIGSGAVEGAVRNLVGIRLDGPGMRWGRQRSEHVLHLRCVLLNGQWDEFHDYLDQDVLTLRSKPVPALAHEAKAAA
jgi:hypothetical protein